ncbi:GNAT family N-acetyltransferase [Flavihumibacter sp. R14]|nr:GNAT family N-acetyltransferase [Flavihumibacter soli]
MEIEIIDYQLSYKEDFKQLNIEWISRYFVLEEPDLEQLEDPEASVLSKGGKIYLARLGEEIIGTITLKKHSDTIFELSKMAVSPAHQGRGAGRLLAEHLIKEARALGCKMLFLESNQKLLPALTLYKKLGFIEVPVGSSPYSRADYRGEMHF